MTYKQLKEEVDMLRRRLQLTLQADSNVSMSLMINMLRRMGEKLQLLHQCAPDDKKEEIAKLIKMNKDQVECFTADDTMMALHECTERIVASESRDEVPLLLELLESLYVPEAATEGMKDRIDAVRSRAIDIVNLPAGQPLRVHALICKVRNCMRELLGDEPTDVDMQLNTAEPLLAELESLKGLTEEQKFEIEFTRKRVREIKALPDEQRRTLEVFKLIHKIRTSIAELRFYDEHGNSKRMYVRVMRRLHKEFILIDACDNLTEDQAQEVVCFKREYVIRRQIMLNKNT